jgi:spore maturation protein CgeB
VLGFKIAQMERKRLLARLSKVAEVNLYTDDEHVDLPGVNNRGIADYWEVAPKIFNRSKINLNFTIRSIRTGIPLRVWDILSAGGFCITNYQPELLMYFENGKDLVIFEDEEDLIEKVKYYLSHEEERKVIAMNGYNKVKNLHKYSDRFDEMKKIIPEL